MALRESTRGPQLEVSTLALAGVPGDLWPRLREARRPLLLLDYDGTLAPFHVRRERALPTEESKRFLDRLASLGRTLLAIFTGRPVAELETLIGNLPAHLVGEHGWEERTPRGPVQKHALSSEAESALERAWKAIAARGLSTRVERKRTALVLHTRGLFPDADEALCRAAEAVWKPWTEKAPLRLDHVHGGIELRAMGRDKGTAALDLRAASSPDFVVYVGDDRTDEDAFRALGEYAVSLRVGSSEEPSLAHGRLPKPEAVGEFLGHWLEIDSAKEPAPKSAP